MAKAENIRGTQKGLNGRNDSYIVIGRGEVSRKTMVKEVLEGKHDGISTYKKGEEIFLRAKPNHRKNDNINKE
jgi:hypothetical protein